MKGKKLSSYSKIYISVVSVFLGLLIIGAVVLWTVLDAYEKTRPKHVARRVFEDYFVSMDIGKLIEEHSPETLAFEKAEDINASISEKLDPEKLEYFSVSTAEDGSEQYAVSLDNKRIAYFTVSPTSKKASYGFQYYELTDAELFLGTYGDVTVKVPKGNTLHINGIEVGAEFISTPDIESVSCNYMPEGVKGIMYDKYTIKNLMFEPEISVTADGKEAEVVFDEAEDCYVASVVYDDELAEEQSRYVLSAATEYTKYLSNDAGFGAVSGYLDKNADIYNTVRSIEVNWVRDHNGYKISDEKATEFYSYADGVYSCRVTLTETLMRPGYANHIEHIDVTFYLHKVNGKYLIYEIVNN